MSVNSGASDLPRIRSRRSSGLLVGLGGRRVAVHVVVDDLVDVVVEVAGHHDQVQDAGVVEVVGVLHEAAEPVVEAHHPGRRLGPPGLGEQGAEQVDAPRHVGVGHVPDAEGVPLPPEVDGVRRDGRAVGHGDVVQDALGHRRRRDRYDDQAAGPVLGRLDDQVDARPRRGRRGEDDAAGDRRAQHRGDRVQRCARARPLHLEDHHLGRVGVARHHDRPADPEEAPPGRRGEPAAVQGDPVLVDPWRCPRRWRARRSVAVPACAPACPRPPVSSSRSSPQHQDERSRSAGSEYVPRPPPAPVVEERATPVVEEADGSECRLETPQAPGSRHAGCVELVCGKC